MANLAEDLSAGLMQKPFPAPGEAWRYAADENGTVQVWRLHTADRDYLVGDWIKVGSKMANFSSYANADDQCVVYDFLGVLHIREIKDFLQNLERC